MNKIITAIAVVAVVSSLMISSLLNNNVYATNKGLRVIVTVENVPSSVFGQTAEVTVSSNSDARVHQTVTIPNQNAFFTELQFGSGEVAVGEGFSACVFISSDLNECASGTNGEQKAPEHVTIFLPNNNNGFERGSGAASSSASNSESSSSSSSSSSATVNNCIAFCGAN